MMLMDLLFGSTRQAVLAVLLLEPESAFHLRALARQTGSHPGTLLRELDKLSSAGLLQRREQGNQVLYQADREHPLFADLAAMFRKTHGVAAALRQALAPVRERIRVALIFGSVARGTQTAGSDIDLLVIGTLDFDELVQRLHPVQQALRREINPVLYSAIEFRARVERGEAFVRNVMTQSVLYLEGGPDDLAELAGDQAPAGARR